MLSWEKQKCLAFTAKISDIEGKIDEFLKQKPTPVITSITSTNCNPGIVLIVIIYQVTFDCSDTHTSIKNLEKLLNEVEKLIS